MEEFQPFETVVPGSTANLGSGFDSIGMALDRFLRLHIEPSDQLELDPKGEALAQVERGRDNLVFRVMEQLFRKAGQQMPSLRIVAESDIPLARGLGSSAAAIVAGLMAANYLLGKPFSRKELFREATEWEGHPDNVGASLFGGVVIASWDGEQVHRVSAPVPPFQLVAAIPRVSLATSRAREVLPASISHGEAVLGSSRANLLTAALLTGDGELLRVGMKDRFHQPYRMALVPGLEELIQEAENYGALGVALSGAGPTVVAFASDPDSVVRYMERVFQRLDVEADIIRLRPSGQGAVVRLTGEEPRSKLVGNIKGASR
ncbi:homoserine kinase [Salinithrix halophila]|uniref:Homoserine kinase n=1 Tax=Salinithrix halophila TaxID=1485204 RepID=A0ABV8JI06_9BACL